MCRNGRTLIIRVKRSAQVCSLRDQRILAVFKTICEAQFGVSEHRPTVFRFEKVDLN